MLRFSVAADDMVDGNRRRVARCSLAGSIQQARGQSRIASITPIVRFLNQAYASAFQAVGFT